MTNGYQSEDRNNQPVVIPSMVGIHNGIITNHQELWLKNNNLKTEIDTEIFLKIFNQKIDNGIFPENALKETYSAIEGTPHYNIF